jgi:hypothetical protein
MATKKSMWVLLSVIIAAWLLGSVAQVMAETRNAKFINRVTKMESVPIPDAEGHSVGMAVIEGATISEDGELAWQKVVIIFDGVKGTGPFTQYATTTFQDGSTITGYTKGTSGGGSPAKQAFEIVHGTGRFQGIKGTGTSTLKFLPPEKGEIGWRTVGEITMTFTLPPK